MSRVIPQEAMRYIEGGKPGEARIAVAKIGGTVENPQLLMLMNTPGVVGLSMILQHAVATAPTPEDKEAWRGLSLQITKALILEMGGTLE